MTTAELPAVESLPGKPAGEGDTPWDQLPLFEGYRFPKADLSFTGGLELNLYDEDDRSLLEALELTQRCVVTLSLGERHVELSAIVRKRTWASTASGMRQKTTLEVDARAPDETAEGDE